MHMIPTFGYIEHRSVQYFSDYISNACWDISCLSCSRFVCWSNSNHMDGLHRFKIGLRRSSQ